ncbi:uncharacterized protein isoform X2 [Choristoneura fumiferana]|uniref:uncharacterized protein isoform X2 n=1 Tax=Choristoneura fumiferana TaxID=7141 RepID=UPI003D15C43E
MPNEIDAEVSPCEVSRLLRRLCAGAGASNGGKNERVSGAKNAQLLCINGGSPRQPSTPQLLRILEETIQKKIPKPQYTPKPKVKDIDRYRLTFNVTAKAAESMFQYRTKFVQHMLSSPMYANSAVGKPWEMIGSVSEQIIDEMLVACAKEMQLQDFIEELYKSETQ